MVELSGIGKAVGGFLLGIFIVALVFTYGFSQVTSYDSLKPVFNDVISEQLSGQLTDENMAQYKIFIDQQCAKSNTINLPVEGMNIEQECREIQNKTTEELRAYASDLIFKPMYYKDYGCSGFACLQKAFEGGIQNMAVLVSAEMNDFVKSLIPYMLAGLIISIFIIVISIRRVFSILKTIGLSFLSAGIVFVIMLVMQYLLPSSDNIFGEFGRTVTNIFIYLYGVVFAIGIALTIIGYVGVHYYENTDKKKKR